MSTVETVRGPIDLEQLGVTLMHEHVFVTSPEFLENVGDQYWDEEVRIADAVSKLKEAKATGVDTILDLTVYGMGRNIPRVQRVNAEVDINIIVATGLYTHDEIPHFLHYRGPGTLLGGSEPMTEIFVRDIQVGIGETGVKAAVLKCVVDEPGLTADQTRVQRAVCEAHQQTGAPITVHTNSAHETGLLALDFYAQNGVDLTKVVVGHAGDSNDLVYLRKIMDQGATIGCDRFGLDLFNTTDQRVKTIAALCKLGYEDRIAISHDAQCYADWFAGEEGQAGLHAIAPNWHFLHLSQVGLPALREAGVTDEQIHTMMAVNPVRYFS